MAKLKAEDVVSRLSSGELLQRQMQVDSDAIDVEARTVWLAASSEAEVTRWFGVEILDHDASSIRGDRLQSGAPLLHEHDRRAQLGVVEEARLDPDRRIRVKVRFSRSVRADEVFQDVVDKIVRNVSVGYRVHGMEKVEKRENTDVWRVTDWEPMEVSMVSMPADTSVGVGRSEAFHVDTGVATEVERCHDARDGEADEPRRAAKEEEDMAGSKEGVDEARVERERAEKARIEEIASLGRNYGATDQALEYVSEGRSVSEFQTFLLDRQKQAPAPATPRATEIGLTDKEARGFSFVKLIRALGADKQDQKLIDEAAFELEACRAAADAYSKATSRPSAGTVIPLDVLTARNTVSAVVNTTGYASQPSLIGTDHMPDSFIELLRNNSAVLSRIRMMTGLVGNVSIPKQTGAGQATWIDPEDAQTTRSNITTGAVTMTPKTLAAHHEITRQLILQSSPDIEQLVRQDIAQVLALEIDRAILYGTGLLGEPLGIAETPGISTDDFVGEYPTFAEVVAMETAIRTANASRPSMAYVGNSGFLGHVKTTEKFSASNGATIYEPGGTVNGMPFVESNQIQPLDVFLGAWQQCLVGMWGGLDMIVDPYTYSDRARLRITAFQSLDVAVRHAESFAYWKGTPDEEEEGEGGGGGG